MEYSFFGGLLMSELILFSVRWLLQPVRHCREGC